MSNRPPAYQHYANDWLVGTAHLTLAQQGAYQRLLDHEWMDGPLPTDLETLARLCGESVPVFRTRIWPKVSPHFVNIKGKYVNLRLESERKKQAKYRRAQAVKGIRSGRLRREQRLVSGSNIGSTGVPTGAQPKGNSSSSSSGRTEATTKGKDLAAGAAGRTTWLTPYDNLWREHFGAALPFGQAAKVLKPLVGEHGDVAVQRALGNYLAAHSGERAAYVSLPKFGATFGQWLNPSGPRTPLQRSFDAIDAALPDEEKV